MTMTRKELMRHMLEKYGETALANGWEARAIIRPMRRQSDEAPQCYLYTGTPEQKLLAGDAVAMNGVDYLVTRGDVEAIGGESLYVWAILRRADEAALCTEESA